jgi:hypothetical protein
MGGGMCDIAIPSSRLILGKWAVLLLCTDFDGETAECCGRRRCYGLEAKLGGITRKTKKEQFDWRGWRSSIPNFYPMWDAGREAMACQIEASCSLAYVGSLVSIGRERERRGARQKPKTDGALCNTSFLSAVLF